MIRVIKCEDRQVSFDEFKTIYTTKDFKDTDTVADIKKFLDNKIERFVGIEIRKEENKQLKEQLRKLNLSDMNKEQQIKELDNDIKQLHIDFPKTNEGFAEGLYRLGYRKQSNVAGEFADKLIEKLEKYVTRHTGNGVPYYVTDCEQLDDEIISLAKEYGVEGEE